MSIFRSGLKFEFEAFQIQVYRFLVIVEVLSGRNKALDRFE